MTAKNLSQHLGLSFPISFYQRCTLKRNKKRLPKNLLRVFDPMICLLKFAINSQKIFAVFFNIPKIFCEFITNLWQKNIAIKDFEQVLKVQYLY